MIRNISKVPLIYSHSSQTYVDLIEILNKEIKALEPRPFGFQAVLKEAQESERFIYPMAQVFRETRIKSIVSNWVKQDLSGFLKVLRFDLNAGDYKQNDFKRLRLTIRLRILMDKGHYTLAPHKDSADTIFAFLLQLNSTNPKTCYFLKDPQVYKFDIKSFKFEDTGMVERVLVGALEGFYGSKVSFKLTHNQFGVSRYVIWDDKGSTWLLKEKDRNVAELSRHDCYRIDAGPNDLVAIHNPLKDFFFSSTISDQIKVHGTHGFAPAEFSERNVLLIDLLGGYTDEDVLPIPNSDYHEGEYFVRLTKNTSHEILKSAGFMV